MESAEIARKLDEERSFSRREGKPSRRARERIEELVDPGSWVEVGLLARDLTHGRERKTPTDGIITGYGTVGGHRVGVLSHDKAVLGGSSGHQAAAKQMRIFTEAQRCGFPVINFGEGGGGRIPDLMGSSFGRTGAIADMSNLGFLARRDRSYTLIACSFDEMYGDPSFAMGLADFPLMVKSSCFAVSGPPIIKEALGEVVSGEELGGPRVHEANGQVARVEDTETEVIRSIQRLVTLTIDQQLPTTDPDDRPTPEIEGMIPDSPARAYDMRRIVRAVVDQDCEPLYLWPGYGGSLLTCFARLGGRTVALLASQPLVRGGVMDTASSRKGIKVIDQAHRLGLPLVFLTDMPGFIVGKDQEAQGLLSAAMDYLRALISADVPKVSLVLRKAYGFGYFAMGGPGWGGDYVAALPSARIAFMGPEPGINLIYRRELDAIADADERGRRQDQLLADWADRALPWEAAYGANIDDLVQAGEARRTLIRAVRALDRRPLS